MSEFTVCRTLDTHPALRYCLLLDDVRIAGGKPDYRGDNILISWRTKETYGPVDAIKTENSQLVTEKAELERRIDELCAEVERLRQIADGAANEADRLTHDAAALQIENAKLCAEVERLHADEAHWELGNCPSCPNVVNLQDALEQNSKLCAEVEALKRDEWSAGFNAGCDAVEAAYEDGEAHYEAENAKLVVKLNAEHIARQNVEVENAKLHEQVDYMTPLALYAASERERDRMRELGIEATA